MMYFITILYIIFFSWYASAFVYHKNKDKDKSHSSFVTLFMGTYAYCVYMFIALLVEKLS